MPKSPNIQARINAISKELANGVSPRQFIPKITKKYGVSVETVSKDIRKAKQAAHEAQQLKEKAEAEALFEATKEAEKRRIMAADERKEYLTKIITGEIEVPYTEVKWDQKAKKFVTIKFVELAGHTARISAISELNKMDGSYAPLKQAIVDDNGKAIKEFKVTLNL